MSEIRLQSPSITLAQAIKAAGIASSGGQAKFTVREGRVRVNGVVEKQPGRKLVAGDRFEVDGSAAWTISAEPEAE